ncbi:biopolymer transporter ExbB [Pontivivens nitratireducens]|uniref:Biopolymer transporter ExbB n=1 Tax=Pontivivens nitratireducens TaxID=2758038 RepID=A0A6G7VHU3_9RHOB|nr:biopolymer transporter ExbB [Pontibrevibacter nitratireducens]QIK39446.1 biopolymer transporter ExbB [Pontibrevibacter nitratireducens]
MLLETEKEPQFSQPIRQVVLMVLVLVLTAIGGGLIYSSIAPIFLANIYLNGFILAMFVVGVLACFWQVLQLISSVNWIEGFALNRPGHEFVQSPRLLASLAALLKDQRARLGLTSNSSRSILDSVATRLDEARDITRYIINLLIFLGLLGTFYGLATTVPAVVETIRSLAPSEGEQGIAVFERLMSGLESQLGGMGTAFASSLLGLAGSLVVGMLELFAGHGQNRFYMELEEWLSSITRIGVASADGEGEAEGGVAYDLAGLGELMHRAEERRVEDGARMAELIGSISALARNLEGGHNTSDPTLTRIADGQDRLIALMEARDAESGALDDETRMRLKNIDVQLLRLLEELSAGRQDSITEIRAEIATLTAALRGD